MSRELDKIRKLYDELIDQEECIFPERYQPLNAPIKQGVYIITDKSGKVLHVGKTDRAKNGLRQRLNNHLQGQSSFTKARFNRTGHKLRGNCKYRCMIVSDPRARTLIEAYDVSHLCPAHLGTGESGVL